MKKTKVNFKIIGVSSYLWNCYFAQELFLILMLFQIMFKFG
ncbi:hypothetical protein RV01_GL000384 [Enterococcus dispar]|nr:hypothetical protein RV01_GL000384 [Enterococcus dispar]